MPRFADDTTHARCLVYIATVDTAGRVGKTSLALRFVHNTFNHSQQATSQASFLAKQVTVGNQQVHTKPNAFAVSHSPASFCLLLTTCMSCKSQCTMDVATNVCHLPHRSSLPSGTQQGRSAFTPWGPYTIVMHRQRYLCMTSVTQTASPVCRHGCKS